MDTIAPDKRIIEVFPLSDRDREWLEMQQYLELECERYLGHQLFTMFALSPAHLGGTMPENTDTPDKPKKKRGFGSMSPEKQCQIASQGGKAVHLQGTGHKWNSTTARAAGRKSRGNKSRGNKKQRQKQQGA